MSECEFGIGGKGTLYGSDVTGCKTIIPLAIFIDLFRIRKYLRNAEYGNRYINLILSIDILKELSLTSLDITVMVICVTIHLYKMYFY